jgi:hypothetical protein
MKWLSGKSPAMIGFFQASLVAIWCLLVGTLIINGEKVFGTNDSFVGPAMFLLLLVASVLMTGIFTLAYPLIVFWDQKDTRRALLVVGRTALWLLIYVLIFLLAARIY